jgi:hypothetical protein
MKTQAWGWLAAAALAAGLNASYHDGGLQWVHQAVDQVEHGSAAVLALAAGHADQFLAEARLVSSHVSSDRVSSDQISSSEDASDQISSDRTGSEQIASTEMAAERDENPSCPWARAMARVHSKVARIEGSFVRLEAMSDRKQADFDRMQARQERLQAQIVAQTDRYRAAAAAFQPVVMRTVEGQAHCQAMQKLLLQRESMRKQAIRINLPQMPNIKIPKIDVDF